MHSSTLEANHSVTEGEETGVTSPAVAERLVELDSSDNLVTVASRRVYALTEEASLTTGEGFAISSSDNELCYVHSLRFYLWFVGGFRTFVRFHRMPP